MIIDHQTNLAAFAGNHSFYWFGQQLITDLVSKTSAPVTPTFKPAFAMDATVVIQPGMQS